MMTDNNKIYLDKDIQSDAVILKNTQKKDRLDFNWNQRYPDNSSQTNPRPTTRRLSTPRQSIARQTIPRQDNSSLKEFLAKVIPRHENSSPRPILRQNK